MATFWKFDGETRRGEQDEFAFELICTVLSPKSDPFGITPEFAHPFLDLMWREAHGASEGEF